MKFSSKRILWVVYGLFVCLLVYMLTRKYVRTRVSLVACLFWSNFNQEKNTHLEDFETSGSFLTFTKTKKINLLKRGHAHIRQLRQKCKPSLNQPVALGFASESLFALSKQQRKQKCRHFFLKVYDYLTE